MSFVPVHPVNMKDSAQCMWIKFTHVTYTYMFKVYFLFHLAGYLKILFFVLQSSNYSFLLVFISRMCITARVRFTIHYMCFCIYNQVWIYIATFQIRITYVNDGGNTAIFETLIGQPLAYHCSFRCKRVNIVDHNC